MKKIVLRLKLFTWWHTKKLKRRESFRTDYGQNPECKRVITKLLNRYERKNDSFVILSRTKDRVKVRPCPKRCRQSAMRRMM